VRTSAPVGALLILLVPLPGGGMAMAQREQRDQSVESLPRPGYEPKRIWIGQTVISPSVVVGATYDNNIFVTQSNRVDDTIFTISPNIGIERDDGTLRLSSDLFATLLRYADNKQENVNTFGFRGDARYTLNRAHAVTAAAAAERSYERRSDPEADINPLRSPAKIDLMRAELGYQYRPNRIGFGINVAVDRLNYLPAVDSDRDLVTWRGSARATMRASSRLDVFVQGYVNRRDARTRVDRNGVDRDTTTKGVLAGAAIDLADRWKGEMGVGIFRANPADPSLRSFSGFAANGSLTWRPRVRTAVTANVFRGDVGTIRAGANGRIDTRISVRVDQEVRHNIILGATLATRETTYRGVQRSQRLRSGELEATYLLNRHFAIVGGGYYSKRSASQPIDQYERFRFQLATRFVY
jgi:hypothetical protein